MTTVWKGTAEEGRELDAACLRWCACTYDQESGLRKTTCSMHMLILDQKILDQKILDDLLFYRRVRNRLVAEEEMRPYDPA